jgi:hypothetical protein
MPAGLGLQQRSARGRVGVRDCEHLGGVVVENRRREVSGPVQRGYLTVRAVAR